MPWVARGSPNLDSPTLGTFPDRGGPGTSFSCRPPGTGLAFSCGESAQFAGWKEVKVVKVTCCSCGHSYALQDSHRGKHARCKCGTTFLVPPAPLEARIVAPLPRIEVACPNCRKRFPVEYEGEPPNRWARVACDHCGVQNRLSACQKELGRQVRQEGEHIGRRLSDGEQGSAACETSGGDGEAMAANPPRKSIWTVPLPELPGPVRPVLQFLGWACAFLVLGICTLLVVGIIAAVCRTVLLGPSDAPRACREADVAKYPVAKDVKQETSFLSLSDGDIETVTASIAIGWLRENYDQNIILGTSHTEVTGFRFTDIGRSGFAAGWVG